MSGILLVADALGAPNAGLVEYDGKLFYATHAGVLRGLLPSELFYRLNSDLAGANSTGTQSLLGVGISLNANTVYEFELDVTLAKTAGATSHSASFGFGGSATLNNLLYTSTEFGVSGALNTNGNSGSAAVMELASNTAALSVVGNTFAVASNYRMWRIKGTVSINVAGTFIPQYSLSSAPGGAYSTVAGSFMKIKPIGASGANINVGGWA